MKRILLRTLAMILAQIASMYLFLRMLEFKFSTSAALALVVAVAVGLGLYFIQTRGKRA
jgi:hypothetical protein